MAKEIIATNLDLKPGVCIKIHGDIPADPEHFRLNLGKDETNLALQFNVLFAHDRKNIICNSIKDGISYREKTVKHSPFEPGKTEVSITFEGKKFKVKLPSGDEFTYRSYLNLETINFLSTAGDFKLRLLAFD